MLTLFHAPFSRSSRVVALLHELGIRDKVEVVVVDVPRADGSGARDFRNLHPEGKVPFLVHDDTAIWESAAIMLYLTDLFPSARFAPRIGEVRRGGYLSWLAYYGNVIEPVLGLDMAGVRHPLLDRTFRGPEAVAARLSGALADYPYLLGDRYTAADLLLSSPFPWCPDATPDDPSVRDWVSRCMARPSVVRVAEEDRHWQARPPLRGRASTVGRSAVRVAA